MLDLLACLLAYYSPHMHTCYLPCIPQWKHSHDERTRRASSDEARECGQNRDESEAEAEAEAAAAGSVELGAPLSFAGARELV